MIDRLYLTRQFVFTLNRISKIDEGTVFEIKDDLTTGNLTELVSTINPSKNGEYINLVNSLGLNVEFLSNGEHTFIEVSRTKSPEMRVQLPFKFFLNNIQDQRVTKEITQ